MNLPVKLGIGVVSLGSVSAIGYASSAYLMNDKKEISSTEQKETKISSLIDAEYKHILLKTSGDEDKDHWATNWNSYKEASQKLDNDIFGLTGWKKVNPTDLTAQLKEKCGKLVGESVPNNSNTTYQNVTKYCARSVTVKDQAEKEKLTIINDDNAGNIWTERAKKKDSLTTHFTNLGITPSPGSDITADNIKTGCGKALTKNKSEDNYQAIYDSYKEVCVKKNNE